MSDRDNLATKLGFTTLLILLAWILIAPIATSVVASTTSRPDRPHHDSDPLLGQPPSRRFLLLDHDAILCADEVPFQTEDLEGTKVEEREKADSMDECQSSFRIARSFHNNPDRPPVVLTAVISLYPLRC